MTTPKIKRHRNLPSGTIVEISLHDGLYAFICSKDSVWFWLYDFVLDTPGVTADLLAPSRWKLPFVVMKDLQTNMRLVASIELTEEQKKRPPTWVRESDSAVRQDDLPTPYRAYSNERGNWYITEEETHHMFPYRSADADDLPAFIAQFLPELELIHIPDSVTRDASALPQVVLPEPDPLDESVVLEIQAPVTCGVNRDAVEDELDEALQNAEVGDMIGAGGGTLGNWDLAVETPERNLKKVLRVIRRVLKAMKMPPGTEIREQRADCEDVVHQLD